MNIRRHEGGRDSLDIARGRRVSPLWRAGAIGLAAAAVVFGVTTLQLQARFESLHAMVRDNSFLTKLVEDTREGWYDIIFNETVDRVVFTPVDPARSGEGALFVDREGDSATLYLNNLAVGGPYRLIVIHDDAALDAPLELDQTTELQSFTADGRLMRRDVDIKDLKPGTRLAVATPTRGGRLTPVLACIIPA
jgi:hypothetical protein